MSDDKTPISQQPLPTQLMIWAMSLTIIIVVLSAAVRAAFWIMEL